MMPLLRAIGMLLPHTPPAEIHEDREMPSGGASGLLQGRCRIRADPGDVHLSLVCVVAPTVEQNPKYPQWG